jgi:hypothetical protein
MPKPDDDAHLTAIRQKVVMEWVDEDPNYITQADLAYVLTIYDALTKERT